MNSYVSPYEKCEKSYVLLCFYLPRKSKQYYDHSFHWNMKSARKSIRLRKGPDAVFVELTAPLEDPEEAFFQPLGKIKVVAMILIKNFIIETYRCNCYR